jgi:hypothetical protein
VAESPLEAAAKAAWLASANFDWPDSVMICDPPIPETYWDSFVDPEEQAGWLDVARAAVAAYEAEQPAPDLDELTAAMNRHFHGTERAPYTMRGHDDDAESCGHCGEAAEVALAHLKGETR